MALPVKAQSDPGDDRRKSRLSLARSTLWRVATRIALVVLVATAFSYWHVRSGIEEQALAGLERYVAERRVRESAPLLDAEESLAMLVRQYEKALQDTGPDASFTDLFVEQEDGTWRTNRDLFDRDSVSGFVGKHATVDAETRKALIGAVDVVRRFGPSWPGRFANGYVLTPDQAVVMYWPGHDWALGGSDWEIFGKLALMREETGGGAVVVSGRRESGPSTGIRWSGLYYDYGVRRWVVSVTRPVVVEGRHIASVGHDLMLQDLIDRTVTSDIEGAYNLLFDSAGNLIAHPRFMEAIQARGGALAVADTDDDHLKALFSLAAEAGRPGGLVEVPGEDEYLAVSRLDGPGWYLLTVFPKNLIASEAVNMAYIVFGLGFAALLVELTILSGVLRHQIGEPLRALVRTADRTRAGDVAHEAILGDLDTRRPDEIGTLARAFKDMLEELERRETALASGNAELSRLNLKLRHELGERKRAESELQRHRELNALLDSIDYGVLFLDADLKSRLANDAYRRMWQTAPDYYDQRRTLREDMEESRRRGLYRVSDADWPHYLDERIDRIRAGPFGPEELHLSNGRIMEYECTALHDGGRMLTYYDITDLKRAQANLRIHLEGMESSMDGMALLDHQGRYIYVNHAHARVYGYEREAMIGLSWRALYDAEELARFDEEIVPVIHSRGRWRGEATGRRHGGQTFPQDLSLAATENGGLVCVVRDISERKARERALDQALQRAEESNAAKTRFLAAMSHELRTPLNAIIGFSRIVSRKTEGVIPERQSDNLAKIQTSAEHLLKLINEILDISKIEAGRMDVAFIPYAPSGVADECLRLIEPMVQPGVALRCDGICDMPHATGDAAKVRQILMNLLANAARHTTAGEISIGVEREGQRLRFAVTDTGIGIPPDAQTTIFEEFARLDGAGRRGAEGTGLGLPISRRLARLMGGDITVRSEPGVGSTFTLDLPFASRSGNVGVAEPGPSQAVGS
ncbi:MAG: ATP-binding protein [Pseudomonadota bacterium]